MNRSDDAAEMPATDASEITETPGPAATDQLLSAFNRIQERLWAKRGRKSFTQCQLRSCRGTLEETTRPVSEPHRQTRQLRRQAEREHAKTLNPDGTPKPERPAGVAMRCSQCNTYQIMRPHSS